MMSVYAGFVTCVCMTQLRVFFSVSIPEFMHSVCMRHGSTLTPPVVEVANWNGEDGGEWDGERGEGTMYTVPTPSISTTSCRGWRRAGGWVSERP